ncbi:MAG: NAD(+) synthase [Planctomycetota bacterium]|jgi:NAD+ synthase (glutamine-hydrolysing)|nr:NAD(+) synthase [Planctomycetota bacterium]
MQDGFFRVAALAPDLRLADCRHNATAIVSAAEKMAKLGAVLTVFPELSLTGYTCGDLFLQETLLTAAEDALLTVKKASRDIASVLVFGLPFRRGSALFNLAAVVHRGHILGLVPKLSPPNYTEFYEARHFTPGPEREKLTLDGETVTLGWRQLFHGILPGQDNFVLGVEICEDLWTPQSPSILLAQAGATLIANLSASNEIVGKAAYRRQLVSLASGKLIAAYVYADAGRGESSTDLVFAGHQLIAENGVVLAEAPPFASASVLADVDLERLAAERRRVLTFKNACLARVNPDDWQINSFPLEAASYPRLERPLSPLPFVPADQGNREERCDEVFAIQVAGLSQRLRHTQAKTLVIGLSGGLDSTLALLASVRAVEALGWDKSRILGVTMPGPGTTPRTLANASQLAASFGATLRTIPITPAVELHFQDIGQNPENRDVTYENSQARERTQILMYIANQTGGIVVGTGDLSELALGWATYNGDHMSMYGVNCSIPKTLVRHLIATQAARLPGESGRLLLEDILATPVSPELLPPSGGEISQKTEELVGPYELHDFFLYYAVRFGFRPRKIRRLAELAFAGQRSPKEILTWLRVFYQRFFSQQFKRSCLPDGPKVGSISLSPRGDWRCPSDVEGKLWLADLEEKTD